MKQVIVTIAAIMVANVTSFSVCAGDIVDGFASGAHESRDSIPVWIFFSDKRLDDVDVALRELERTYNSRAIARRRLRRTAPGLFDIRDLPVAEAYIAEILPQVDRIRVRSRWLNAVSADVPRQALPKIAMLPFVRSIERVHHTDGPELRDVREISHNDLNPGFYGLSFEQLSTINLPPVHDAGWTGAGVVIGVLDTGFKRTHSAFNHPDNPLNVIAEYDFINDDPNTGPESGDDPNQHWHGSVILGTMAGYNPGTYVGAAYQASFILCKTEDITNEYQGEEDFYVAGLEFIEANGGDIATSSLQYLDWYTQQDMDGQTAVTTIGVNTATQNGVYCCTAVGNSGHDQNPSTSHLGAPADAFQVFSVGSVNIFGEESGFSADGPTVDGRVKPEILAVGRSAVSIDPANDTGYLEASGTSLSTPQLAGCVACLVQFDPTLSVDAMRDAFMLTATDYVLNGAYDPNFVRGYGVTDAFAALGAAGPSIAAITDLTITTGTLLSGDVSDIQTSDNLYVHVRSGFGQSLIDLHHMRAEVNATTSKTNPATLELSIETHISESSGMAEIAVFNHTTSQFDIVWQYALGQSDSTEVISNIDAGMYIGPSGEIRVSTKHIVFVPFLAFTFESWLDLMEIRVN